MDTQRTSLVQVARRASLSATQPGRPAARVAQGGAVVEGPVKGAAPEAAEYVDPYLFESGFFASRAEYEELMRTAVIRPRNEVEFARPKRGRKR